MMFDRFNIIKIKIEIEIYIIKELQMYGKTKPYPHNYYSPKATPNNTYYKGLSDEADNSNRSADKYNLDADPENRVKSKYYPDFVHQRSIEDFRSVGRRAENHKYRGMLGQDGFSGN